MERSLSLSIRDMGGRRLWKRWINVFLYVVTVIASTIGVVLRMDAKQILKIKKV
tara:strand:+ start:65 stop:226 length:162 start_codon:yes stop_codon:yes gene_type:complete